MKILFFMRHPGYVRNFESVFHELARRDHEIHLAFDSLRTAWTGGRNPVETLCADIPRLTYSVVPKRSKGRPAELARRARSALDFLRYLGPEYEHAPKLRARAEDKAPRIVRSITAHRLGRTSVARRLLRKSLRTLELAVAETEAIESLIAAQRPQVLLVTPLVGIGSDQIDYIRAARRLRIPSIHAVASWDNLTNKGLIHESPDAVVVWNEPQREEAIGLHHIEPSRVVATGAHSYDHWFEWSASRDRDAFAQEVGLDPAHPILLYVCSSSFIAPNEAPFVRRWLAALRSSSSPLARAGVVVRPHPQNAGQWEGVDLDDLGAAVVWPRAGSDPIDEHARSDFFDSIFHSAAVVGINTSAQIESAIVGREVFTILDPEFSTTQEGTLHFAHLTKGAAPLLHVATDLDEHLAQLEDLLRRQETAAQQGRREAFLREFVRPYGLTERAAPRMADVIDEVARAEPLPAVREIPAALLARLLRLVLAVRRAPRRRRHDPAAGSGSALSEELR